MNQAKYYTLDVFTDAKYGGNQLAVFPDATSIDADLFQKIARELNLSETVFLFPPQDGQPHTMRIFTPMTELPTAGHPTIGTAFCLAEQLKNKTGTQRIPLQQQVGRIEVEVSFKNNRPDVLTMYQPLPQFGPTHNDLLPELAAMLSLATEDFENFPVQEVSCGNNTLLLPLKSKAALSKAKLRQDVWEHIRDRVNRPLFYAFTVNEVTGGDVQGRMFGPEAGILEDPATGSANGPLMAYLLEHKILSPPVISLQGYEMGRPSQLFLDASRDEAGQFTEVKVGGKCVLTGEGVLFPGPE